MNNPEIISCAVNMTVSVSIYIMHGTDSAKVCAIFDFNKMKRISQHVRSTTFTVDYSVIH